MASLEINSGLIANAFSVGAFSAITATVVWLGRKIIDQRYLITQIKPSEMALFSAISLIAHWTINNVIVHALIKIKYMPSEKQFVVLNYVKEISIYSLSFFVLSRQRPITLAQGVYMYVINAWAFSKFKTS